MTGLGRLADEPRTAAAILGEVLLAREFGGAPHDRLLAGLLDRNGIRKPGRACGVLFPDLAERPFQHADRLDGLRAIAQSRDVIRAELQTACRGDGFRPYRQAASDFIRSGDWTTLSLAFADGRRAEHAPACPQTVGLIEAMPEFCEVAMLSRLAPGGRILPHSGPWNARLVVHFGIDIPERCGIRVGTETRGWEEGEMLVFDDSFSHECWNDSHRARDLLLFAIWHPDWTDDEVSLLRIIERLIGGQYWTHPASGDRLREFSGFSRIADADGNRALWPATVRPPSGWRVEGAHFYHSLEYANLS